MYIYILKVLFWVSLFVVFYAYVGYGTLLYILIKLKRLFNGQPKLPIPSDLPEVTFLVAAYNEEDWIEEKIKNGLSFNYPIEKIHFFYVTDGSNDRTPQLIEDYKIPKGVNLKLFHQPQRQGKIAAV